MYKILDVAIIFLIAFGEAKSLDELEEIEDIQLDGENKSSQFERSNVARDNENLQIPENVPKIRSKRVINGNIISIFDAPWSGHLRWLDGKRRHSVCGASIISENFLLTAAQCVCKYNTYPSIKKNAKFTLRTGDTTYFRGTKQKISDIICHPDFENVEQRGNRYRFQDDIALIKLESNLTFDSSQRPVSITPLSAQHIYVNRTMNFSGWGYPIKSRTSYSNNILGTKLQLMSQKDCEDVVKPDKLAPNNLESKFCARAINDSYPYIGDEGAGLTLDGILVGIYIKVIDADNDVPSAFIFTDVSHYLRWIYNYTIPFSIRTIK